MPVMNKKFIYLLALVFSLGLTFVACGDDDDDNPPKPTDYAAQIAGTYNGTLNVKIGEAPGEDVPDQPIKLDRTGDNKSQLVIENFTFAGVNAGTVTVDNIAITESNGTVKLADTSKNVSLASNTMTADVAVKSSSVKDKTLTLSITVTNIKDKEGETVPDLGTITVTFSGDKK